MRDSNSCLSSRENGDPLAYEPEFWAGSVLLLVLGAHRGGGGFSPGNIQGHGSGLDLIEDVPSEKYNMQINSTNSLVFIIGHNAYSKGKIWG